MMDERSISQLRPRLTGMRLPAAGRSSGRYREHTSTGLLACWIPNLVGVLDVCMHTYLSTCT
jgi:hypothetical protein